MSKFTVGFVFDSSLEHVLLVHKQRPEWQAGKVNGIGGKIEPGETALECIARECEEESTLKIPPSDWLHFGTIHQPQGNVEVLAAAYGGGHSDASQNDHEAVEWFPINHLPDNVMQNLHFLIPAAKLKLEGYHLEKLEIHYK